MALVYSSFSVFRRSAPIVSAEDVEFALKSFVRIEVLRLS